MQYIVKCMLLRLFFIILCCSVVKAGHANNIVLASSSALTGPAASLGVKLNRGAKLYFDKVNQAGGVNGQLIELRVLDDGYEPFKTYQNTQKLLQLNELFALFNFVGTPTSHAILPLLDKYQPLYLTPFTGANFLRDPIKPLVFNLRPSYFQEVEAQIDYLINKANVKNIALVVQADEFGLTVEAGYLMKMKKHGIKPVVTTRYRRNTEDIGLSLDIMKQFPIDAVAFVGTYEPFAHLINLAAEQNFNPYFSSVSFVSSQDLFSRIKVPARILVTEVLPNPADCKLRSCEEFRHDSKLANLTEIDHIVFEGYLNAKLFVEVAKQCGKVLTRNCFVNKINTFNQNLGGFKVSFSKENHQGLEQIYFNIYDTIRPKKSTRK